MREKCAACRQLAYSAVPVVAVAQAGGDEQVEFRNLRAITTMPWAVETFMQEEDEMLSAIARGAISSHGMLMLSLSPQSILSCDEELLAKAAAAQTLLLNVKTDPVPLDYLEKIGRVLTQWRGRYGVKIAMDGLHESNFPLQRMAHFDPDYLRIPAIATGEHLHAGPASRAESMVRKLAEMTVLCARNEGIKVIVSDVSTEKEQNDAILLGASHIEGSFVSARYFEKTYYFDLERSAFANGCDPVAAMLCEKANMKNSGA